MVKEKATRSGRKAATTKYKNVIEMYQPHLAVQEKRLKIQRKMGQCRVVAVVLQDVVNQEVQDALRHLKEAEDDIVKFTSVLSAEALSSLANVEDVTFTS